MTDPELAEAYEQHAQTCREWITAARRELKSLDPDGQEAKRKKRLISGLAAQKKTAAGGCGAPARGACRWNQRAREARKEVHAAAAVLKENPCVLAKSVL